VTCAPLASAQSPFNHRSVAASPILGELLLVGFRIAAARRPGMYLNARLSKFPPPKPGTEPKILRPGRGDGSGLMTVGFKQPITARLIYCLPPNPLRAGLGCRGFRGPTLV
jgi:hypothetical protein